MTWHIQDDTYYEMFKWLLNMVRTSALVIKREALILPRSFTRNKDSDSVT